jgi:type I restriction enzyme S subunit
MMRYKFDDIAINSTEKRMPTEDDMQTYIGLEHLDSGHIFVTRWGSDVPIKGEKLVMHKGDVLFGKRNTYLKRTAIAPHDGLFSAHGMVLRPKTNVISPEFFSLFLSSDYFYDAAIRISVGSLSPTINWRDLKVLEFDLPDLEQQNKLAKVLWAIIDAKEADEKLLRQTDELVKARFFEMFGDPISNDKGWNTDPLTAVCSRIYGGGTPSKSHPEYFEGSIPWVSPKDMKSDVITDSIDHITEEAIANSTTNLVPEGSVLMVIRSGILKHDLPVSINAVPVTINQDMKAFVPGENITASFLRNYFKAIELDVLAGVRGVTADNIDFKAFQQRKIIVPPIHLQEEFEDFCRQVDKSKAALQKAIDDLDAMYKRILKDNLG